MEIQISQDIRKFKTKDIGNFTFKEAAYLAVAAVTGFAVYKLTGRFEIALVPAAIILIIGFFKPFGMSAITFFRTVVKENLTAQCYINETDFVYDYDEFKEFYGEDVFIPTSEVVIQTTKPVKLNKTQAERIFGKIK